MAALDGNRQFDTAALAHVEAAERLASAAVVGFDSCEQIGVPLSNAQKTAVLRAMLLEFDGCGEHLSSLERVGEFLRELGDN